MSQPSAIITVMAMAAKKAALGLVKDFGEIDKLQVSQKGPADFVSAADLRADETLRRELSRARPQYNLVTEESEAKPLDPDQPTFYVDPLDGTTNFLHAIPHFCISIGLVEKEQPVAGVIYDPIKDELFWAERGCGAFVNDHRMRVSSRTQLNQALLATGIPFKGSRGIERVARFSKQLSNVADHIAGIRRMGAAALDLAYTAAGRYEAYWEEGCFPWDLAAGIVMVREAGGMVSELDGRDRVLHGESIFASNGHFHDSLRKRLVG
jgi:myo-inositol-1(or 4)-monophosphatase